MRASNEVFYDKIVVKEYLSALQHGWLSGTAKAESYNALFVKHTFEHLGVATSTRSAVFLNIVQKAFDPPPLRFEHYVVIFFDGFLKKRVNVCRNKIRQNNA